jgi:hypothetical protein
MNCEEVQEHLLTQSDEVTAPDGVSGRITEHVAQHMRACAACGELARKLRRLDSAVRSLPVPLGSAEARMRFEGKLAAGEFERRSARSVYGVIHRVVRSRLAAAAVLILCLGGALLVYMVRQSEASYKSAQAIDQVVSWNLSLSQVDSIDERQKMYDIGAVDLRQRVGAYSLTDDDRRVTDDLMLGGKFLANSADPLADADHFSQVADVLVSRMDHDARKSPKALDQLGQTYYMVVDKGVRRNLARAQAAEAVDSPERQRRIEKIIERNVRLQSKLQALLDQSPDDSKPQLRKALDLTKKAPRQRRAQGDKPASRPATNPARPTSQPSDR